MHFYELLLIAVALSMDAFAVSVCKGLALPKAGLRAYLTMGLYFGVFQAAMPIIGYYIGSLFAGAIERFDHWIAFLLLAVIGGKMIWESFRKEPEDEGDVSLKTRDMLVLAVATSIDALAVGISFALLSVQIFSAASVIGVTTMALSMLGVKIGSVFGARFKSKAELIGGIVLVLIGLKILLEHLGVLG